VSRTCNSLALDDTAEFNHTARIDRDFEPQLQVIVNTHYHSSSLSKSPQVMQITGSITISF